MNIPLPDLLNRIHIKTAPEHYIAHALWLVRASRLQMKLGGKECFLDGHYLLCAKEYPALQSGSVTGSFLYFPVGFFDTLNLPVGALFEEDPPLLCLSAEDFKELSLLFLKIKRTLVEKESLRAKKPPLPLSSSLFSLDEHSSVFCVRLAEDLEELFEALIKLKGGESLNKDTELFEYIDSHMDLPLDIPDLCERFRTNRTSLARTIKKRSGLAPMQYILERRLLAAQGALLERADSVTKIALAHGFTDEVYFIRAFKKRFGITPAAYRRSHRQAIPCQNQEPRMSVAQFEHDLKLGLGRAVVRLRAEENKEPFKQPLKAHIFSHISLSGRYERDLIDCFDDRKELRSEICSALLEDLKVNIHSVAIGFLNQMGYREEATRIMEELYAAAHEDLLLELKQGIDGEQGADADHPSAATRYMKVTWAIGRLVKPGFARVKAILIDIADFFDYSEAPPIPCGQCPLFGLYDGMGKENFFEVFEEVCANHRNGQKLRAEFVLTRDPLPLPPAKHLTSKQVIDHLKEGTFPHAPLCSAQSKEVAELLMAEQDPTVLAKGLFLFVSDPEEQRPVFPLHPAFLIDIIKREASSKDRRLFHAATAAINPIRHPAARDFALQILQDEGAQVDLLCCGLFLLAHNYTPADRAFLKSVLMRKHPDPRYRNAARQVLLILAKQEEQDAPYELLFDFFESERNDFVRLELAKALFLTGQMTEELRNECLYDRLPQTRELAAQIDPAVHLHLPPY